MTCKICYNNNTTQYIAKEMMFGLEEEFPYYQCEECKTLQIRDIPEAMSKFYPENYYSYGMTYSGNFLKNLLRKMRNLYAVTGKGMIGRVLHSRKPDPSLRSIQRIGIDRACRLLDVGCGSGAFIRDLMELGFRNLRGIDPYNEEDITLSDEVSIFKRDIFETKGTWDLITLHHSFEHMEDPEKVLESLKDKLAPEGTIVIRIPVADSYAWQEYGVDWVQLDAPRHFYLHTEKSMEILASKTGLIVEHVIRDSWEFQFWGSEQYRKGIPLVGKRSYRDNPNSSMFTDQDIKNFKVRAKELNEAGTGDQAVFYLKHKAG